MEIFIILLLILLNGLFAMSEIALISARKSNLTAQAKQGNKRARQALKLAEDPNKFLSTVQIGITLIGILTGIYSGAAIADDLREVFVRWGVPYAAPVAQTLIVIVVTYLTIVFGELIPKRIGMTAAEPVAKLVAGPMKVLSVVASPFVWLLSKSIEGISRLFGLRDTDSPVTEAEIKSIVQEGAEDGAVQAVEQKIVGRVFSLGDRSVESIMTHRSDIAWLDVNMSVDEIRDLVRREPHGRYPVGEGSLDRLVGVVYLKDLFSHIGDPGFSLRQILSPVKLFHEGAEVYMALEQLRTEQLGYGIVCDEFGVTQGIVTLKDIFEALVGELLEDREEPDIVVREDGSVYITKTRSRFRKPLWFPAGTRFSYLIFLLQFKCLADAVVMQEFTFCGVLFDFVRRSKTVAVCFFLLKMEIFVFDIHHEAIDIDKVIVSLIRVDAPVGKEITAVSLAHIESGFLSDLTAHGLQRALSCLCRAAGNLPPARCPGFRHDTFCDKKGPIRSCDYAEYGQVKLARLHMPVIPLHRAAGRLFVFIIDIPEFHIVFSPVELLPSPISIFLPFRMVLQTPFSRSLTGTVCFQNNSTALYQIMTTITSTIL